MQSNPVGFLSWLMPVALFVQAPAMLADESVRFSEETLLNHVRRLADRSLLGREAGTAFERRAAEYVTQQLTAMHVGPLASGERMQHFALVTREGASKSINVFGAIGPHGDDVRMIVLGAHLDHLGASDDGGYYPGADDNASGVALTLEVARELQRDAASLKRTVVIAFFGAEEKGLVGSHQFVRAGPLQHSRIAAMVNIDMIGRPLADQARLGGLKRLMRIDDEKGIGVVGTQGRPFLAEIVSKACQRAELTPYGTQAVLSPLVKTLARNRSDHAAFEGVGVPTVFFGSGESDDYHKTSDTVDKVRGDLMVRRAQVVHDVVRTLATVPAAKLPRRENSLPPDGEKVRTLRLQAGKLTVLLRDNSESPSRLSGLQSLFHEHTPGFDAFDPDAEGSSAGLNFEHIISGHPNRSNQFTPRHGPYELYGRQDDASATLVRFREHSPWDVSSTLTYQVKEPHYVDFEFECTPHSKQVFGKRGHAIFFFANYMNDVIDPAIHFRGVRSRGDDETWIAAAAPNEHADWNTGGTYRHTDADPVAYDDDHQFKLNSWSYDHPRYARPFYYGRADNEMVMILMFDRAHTARDEIRFSLFKFKLPKRPRPAWDFQYVIRRVAENQRYGFRGRLVWKRWVSQDDCLREYQAWRKELTNRASGRSE